MFEFQPIKIIFHAQGFFPTPTKPSNRLLKQQQQGGQPR